MVLAIVSAAPAEAFKWRQCPPPPVPVNRSVLGGTNSPFVHPGHDLTILLNDEEVQLTEGFRTDVAGNSIAVTFVSLFGDPIVLPARSAMAESTASLTFKFPDTLAEVGRTLSGPVEIVVSTGDKEVAHIAAEDLVALPSPVDLTPLLLGDLSARIVPAALGHDGDLWLPVSFSGKPMGGMPGCDGDDFIMPIPMQVSGATVVGDVLFPFSPTERIRRIDGYLADIILNGTSYYGLLYPEQINLVQVGDTLGVSVCRLNDATSLVMRVRSNQGWVQANSPFRLVARDSTPLALELHKAPLVPRSATATASANDLDALGRVDSFGSQCSTLPTKGNSTASVKPAARQ